MRGRNTIHILSANGKRIAHFGDLGCKLPADQLAQLKDLDIAMIPVGGHYTIDAAQAADLVCKIAPAHVIPMHYRGDNNAFGFDVIGTVQLSISITCLLNKCLFSSLRMLKQVPAHTAEYFNIIRVAPD